MGGAVAQCAVVIPTFNGAGLTAACLDALLSRPPATCRQRIVVVDDGSTDDTAQMLGRFGAEITFVAQESNQGFARACNAGAEAAGECDYLVFLNNDTLPTAGWLDALVAEAQGPAQPAVVGARLLFLNGQVQHAGVVIGQDRWPHHLYAGFPGSHPAVQRSRDVTAVTAACLLINRRDFLALGGFDPAFHNGYEDVDLCLRLRENGRSIRYCHRSVVYHLESVTRWPTGEPTDLGGAAAVFDQRWRTRLTPDDVAQYLTDGLMSFSYGPYYPLRLTVSPELGAVHRDEAALTEMDRLVEARADQVMELLSRETRRQLRGRAATAAPYLSAALRRSEPELIASGTEHRLGDGAGGRLISVLLPVKDGAPFLQDLLPALLRQSLSARLEIIAVDSGSGDDSVGLLTGHGATVLAIPASEFNHGETRNLLASHARGDVLVFLSQRARPVGDRWLAPLVATLEADPEVVGVCSRVLPYPTADLLTRRDAELELSGSGERTRRQITDWAAYRALTEHERRVFINFHTVSAAIRAEAWRDTRFQAVRTLGEDLLWAREVIESGWAIVHEPASTVHHSHDYSLAELFARNVDDGIANRDINGRTFERDHIVAQITALARQDWTYLRDVPGLGGTDLEELQLEAVLRRTAQAVGQWLGSNYEEMPPGTATQFSAMPAARSHPSNGTSS
jgi:GT2 family glycosyltransferase